MSTTPPGSAVATPVASEGAPPPTPAECHKLSVDEALARLNSAPDGLGVADAQRRLAEHGRNELVESGSKHPLRLLWEQISAVMVLILIGAAALSFALGKLAEGIAISTIVVLFAVLGFIQEYRAERAIAALRRLAVPTVRTMRDGVATEVPAGELVPGDVVLLEAGNIVAADLRVVEAAALRIQEAALTGESDPVDKTTAVLEGDDLAVGDRRNMAYSGTQVTYGRGRGVVVATGMATELGRIAELLAGVAASETPLQQRLDRVGKQLALAGLAVAAIVVAMGALGGESAADLVLTAISVAVAVIPEGLPAVVTFTLAVGAQRMLRRNALIRKLPAVETLGSVTVICSDKTGTLTENRMTATVLEVPGTTVSLTEPNLVPDEAMAALVAGALCNDGEVRVGADGAVSTLGDPTETALISAALGAGLDVGGLRSAMARTGERPFDSERKRMSTLHARPAPGAVPAVVHALGEASGATALSFVKGAPDGLIELSAAVWHGGGIVPMTADRRRWAIEANDSLAAQGMRVLGLAFRPMADGEGVEESERELVLLGLVGIIDPPRAEVRDAVAVCKSAGVRTVMITGDHPLTARAIAAELGIATDGRACTGAELDRLDDAGLAAEVATTSVFARVSPEHKLRIVEALQAQGAVAAMTGDGVNDAPALKQADIGVAMGITGTDVSKEASDMVLRDDNFATIVAAVEEGRVIYDNLRRFVKFAVAGNLGKILVMLVWPVPFLLAGGDIEHAVALLPLQLLWLNLMTDGLLGLSLGVEPAERDVMARPPHAPGGSIWAGGLGVQTAWTGVVIGMAALAIGFVYEARDSHLWQTMLFSSLAFLQIFQAIGSRSSDPERRSIDLRSNPVMAGIVTLVVLLQFAALYTPLRGFLDVEPLGLVDLGVCVGAGAGLLALMEIERAVMARRRAAAVPASVSGIAVR